MAEASAEPLVSVCIPVLNGGELVVRAVQSALNQEYPRLELVVVDDASTDSTFESLRAHFGERIRLFANASRAGQARTTNAAIRHSRGSLVKFLHHDDQLDPDCVSTMVPLFVEHPTMGLVFSRRRLELEGVADSSEWRDRFAGHQHGFVRLDTVNRAPALFKELLNDGFRSNLIGEPSNVMVRRRCIEALGGFSLHARQWTDFDLWLRILALYDVGFVDRELSTYRRSDDSVTARNSVSGESWLDRLWIIENLMSCRPIRDQFPELHRMRHAERQMAWRSAVRGMLKLAENSAPPKPWIDYVGYRIRSRISPLEISGRI